MEKPGGSSSTAAYSVDDSQTVFNTTTSPNSSTNNGTFTNVSVVVMSSEGYSMSIAFYGAEREPSITIIHPANNSNVTTNYTSLIISTDVQSICRYSNDSSLNFSQMALFNHTNSTLHNSTVQTESRGAYNFYFRCNSTYGIVDNASVWLHFTSIYNRAPTITFAYPSASQLSIAEPNNQSFSVNASDPDNDTLSFSWFLNGTAVDSVNTSNNSTYVFLGNYSSQGLYNITVFVSDGYVNSSHSWLMTVNNTNAAPSVYNVSISPATASYHDNLTCTYTFNDTDNDADNSSIYWYVNNTLVAVNTSTLYSGNLSYNVTVVCSVIPYDGTDYGSEVNASSVILESFTLSIVQGWNLISIPLILSNYTIDSVLAGVNFSDVFSVNHDNYSEYINYSSGGLENFSLMRGYWIHSYENKTITIKGMIPTYNLSINNSVPVDIVAPLFHSASLSIINASSVWYYSSSWYGYSPYLSTGTITNLTPGRGYLVYRDALNGPSSEPFPAPPLMVVATVAPQNGTYILTQTLGNQTNSSSGNFTSYLFDISLNASQTEIEINLSSSDNRSYYLHSLNLSAGQAANHLLNLSSVALVNLYPSVVLESPANSTTTPNTSLSLTFYAYDSYTMNCSLLINGTFNTSLVVNDSSTSNSSLHSFNVSFPSQSASYLWSVNCTNSISDSGRASFILNIDRTGPTIAGVNPSYNNQSINAEYNTTVLFIANSSEQVLYAQVNINNLSSSGWRNMSLSYTADGTNMSYYYDVGSIEESRLVSFRAFDNYSNERIINFSVIIDTVSPNATITAIANYTSPSDYLHLSPPFWINYSYADTYLDDAYYTLDLDSSITNETARLIFSIAPGLHHFTIYANDSAGNLQYDSIWFIIDSALNTTNLTISSGDVLNTTIIPSEENETNGTLPLNQTLNITLIVNASHTLFNVHLTNLYGLMANWNYSIHVNSTISSTTNNSIRSLGETPNVVMNINTSAFIPQDSYNATVIINDSAVSYDSIFYCNASLCVLLHSCENNSFQGDNCYYTNSSTNTTYVYLDHFSSVVLATDNRMASVEVFSPVNETAQINDRQPLAFKVNETIRYAYYSLDSSSLINISSMLTYSVENGINKTFYNESLNGALPNGLLTNGVHTIVINLTDASSNTGSVTHTFLVNDTAAPGVNITFNSASLNQTTISQHSSSITINISSDEYSNMSYAFNNASLFVSLYNNSLSKTLSLTLSSSSNFIILNFTDEHGNHGLANYNFTFVHYTCSDGVKNGDELGVDCGGSCSACKSSSGGSGGGGGGAFFLAPRKETFRHFWNNILPGAVLTASFDSKKIPLRKLEVVFNKSMTQAGLKVAEASSNASITKLLGNRRLFSMFEVSPEKFTEGLGSINLYFNVPMEWLFDYGFNKADISLYYYDGSSLTPLGASFVSSDGVKDLFKSVTKRTGTFVIAASSMGTYKNNRKLLKSSNQFEIIDAIRAFYEGASKYSAFDIIDMIRSFYDSH